MPFLSLRISIFPSLLCPCLCIPAFWEGPETSIHYYFLFLVRESVARWRRLCAPIDVVPKTPAFQSGHTVSIRPVRTAEAGLRFPSSLLPCLFPIPFHSVSGVSSRLHQFQTGKGRGGGGEEEKTKEKSPQFDEREIEIRHRQNLCIQGLRPPIYLYELTLLYM